MGEEMKLVVFILEAEDSTGEFGILINQVYEINRVSKIVKLPQVPAFVEGVMNLRGDVIPVIDLKKRLGLGETIDKDTTRIIVVNLGGKKCGILVDDVLEILKITGDAIDYAPAITENISSKYTTGLGKVGDRLIIILDIEKILTDSDQQKFSSTV